MDRDGLEKNKGIACVALQILYSFPVSGKVALLLLIHYIRSVKIVLFENVS